MPYVHSIPGRLRVRTAQLRGQPRRVQQVRDRLGTLTGIDAVTVSSVTGSVLVSYDHEMLPLEEMWTTLHGVGCVPAGSPPAHGSDAGRAFGGATEALIEGLVQKAAEVSAIALIRALI